MRSLKALLVILFLLVAPRVRAQENLQMDVDDAVFAYDGNQSLVEIYLAVPARTLAFKKSASGYTTQLPLHFEILKDGKTAWQDSTTLSFLAPDSAAAMGGQLFVHQVRTTIAPGQYELHVRVPSDASAGRHELEVRRALTVPSFAGLSRTALSGITLSSSLAPSQNREETFFKNGLSIRPNPNAVFGQGLPNVFYYFETYEAARAAGGDGKYTVNTYITDSSRPEPIGQLQKSVKRDPRAPDVVIGSFNVSALPSGAYLLHADVIDGAGNKAAEQTHKFFVYNPSVARQETGTGVEVAYEASDYSRMLEADVNTEMQQIEAIATDRERRQIKDTRNLDEKRRFLKNFWDKRSVGPNAASNTARREFMQRVQFAIERFTSNAGPGWKSDRGRVLLKYGSPNNIEPHLYDPDTKAYEIWEYNNIPGTGQAIFVFADRRGFGQFEMIHSTARGEVSLPDWQSELVR